MQATDKELVKLYKANRDELIEDVRVLNEKLDRIEAFVDFKILSNQAADSISESNTTLTKLGEVEMKTKEFIERVEELGLVVQTNPKGTFVRKDDDTTCVLVDETYAYSFDTFHCSYDYLEDSVKRKLFKLLVEYASTPLEEREEQEKKYYIKHKYLANGWNYLNYIEEIEAWRITWKQESDLSLTQFTLAELPGWVHEMLEDGYLVKEEVE